MDETGLPPSPRKEELLERAYQYVLSRGLADLSLRPLAAAIGSSPRVLLFLFGSKDDLVRALLARARADELAFLEQARVTGQAGLDAAVRATLVTITDNGLALFGRVLPGHVQVVRRLLFDPLSADDLHHLGDIVCRAAGGTAWRRNRIRRAHPRAGRPARRAARPARHRRHRPRHGRHPPLPAPDLDGRRGR